MLPIGSAAYSVREIIVLGFLFSRT
jgi:hypothetical protein